LRQAGEFSPVTPVYSTNKTVHHNITEILFELIALVVIGTDCTGSCKVSWTVNVDPYRKLASNTLVQHFHDFICPTNLSAYPHDPCNDKHKNAVKCNSIWYKSMWATRHTIHDFTIRGSTLRSKSLDGSCEVVS
jgi:hypothetical protein